MLTFKKDKKTGKYRITVYESGIIARKPLSCKPIDNGGFDTIIEADQAVLKQNKRRANESKKRI